MACPSASETFVADSHEDGALLHRLREAICEDNQAAVMCIKTAIKDGSEEQWNRLFNQLESRHQAYLQHKTEQHDQELKELQELVVRNLAIERRLLDEQLANHRIALSGGDGLDVSSAYESNEGGAAHKSSNFGDLSTGTLVDRKLLCDHLADTEQSGCSVVSRDQEVWQLRSALARSRRQCDAYLSRLCAAEAELQFLRNRRQSRRTQSLSDQGAADAAVDSAACLRRSLADLERRQLIDTADALDLTEDPAALERRYDSLQVERREVEATLTRIPGLGSVHHSWHSARDKELLETKLDNIDRELVHLRNSLKQFQLI